MTQTLETTTQLETIKKVELGLAAFAAKKDSFTKLAEEAALINITDFTDKAAIKQVTAFRISLKNERVSVTKEAKGMRDNFTAINKFISSKENEIVSIIEPQEKRLSQLEDWVEAENKRVEDEKIAAENDRIQKMIDALQEYGYELDYVELKNMSEETFQIALSGAKSEYEKEQSEKAEAERLELELKEKERLELESEQAKIAAERKELEELREKQAESDRIIKEQQEETARKQKEAQDKIDAENKRLADEKAAIEAEKQRVIDEEKRKEELRLATEKAAEEARLKAIEDTKSAELKKKEDERIANELAAEKAAQAPDKIKIETYIANLMSIPVPELKTKKSKDIMSSIQDLMNKVNDFSNKKVSEL